MGITISCSSHWWCNHSGCNGNRSNRPLPKRPTFYQNAPFYFQNENIVESGVKYHNPNPNANDKL